MDKNYSNILVAFQSLIPDAPLKDIERTACRLEEMNFSPTLLFPVEGLIRMNHSQWLKEFYTIKELSQKALLDLGVPEDKNILEYKEKQLSLLLYWCELIFRLRQDEPEAWDEIYELYEDD